MNDLIQRLRAEEGRRAVRLGNNLTMRYAHREDTRALLCEAADALAEAEAETETLRAELEIAKGQAEFYRTERNKCQRRAGTA